MAIFEVKVKMKNGKTYEFRAGESEDENLISFWKDELNNNDFVDFYGCERFVIVRSEDISEVEFVPIR